jgi:mycothiol synthase
MHSNDFTIRNYRADDFDSFARLNVEAEHHDRSGRYTSRQRLAEDLGHPRFQPENNLFVAEKGESLIGCVSAFLEPEIGRTLLDGLVHPLHRKMGIATCLYDHAWQLAGKAGLEVAQICIAETNRAAKHLMRRLRFQFIRRFIGMQMELADHSLPDITPDNYTIRHLQGGEVQALTDIQNRSFADAWGFNPNSREEIAYRINLSTCTAEDIIMAYRGDRPIGYCWTRKLIDQSAPAKKIKGEIHMLGVDPNFRKQHVGRNVLLAGLAHLRSEGITHIELTTDAEDPVAGRLYESIGFKESIILEWYETKLAPSTT